MRTIRRHGNDKKPINDYDILASDLRSSRDRQSKTIKHTSNVSCVGIVSEIPMICDPQEIASQKQLRILLTLAV